MSIWGDLIPAIVVLFSNLFAGEHGTARYQQVTAIFGWSAALGFGFGFIVIPILHFVAPEAEELVKPYCIQFTSFTSLAALSRDYERLLKPWARELLKKHGMQ